MRQRAAEPQTTDDPGALMGSETGPRDDLAVANLEVVYNDVVLVLRGVSLRVRSGEIVALLGANGAGKTTLLRAITGLLPVHRGRITKGHVTLAGRDVTGDQLRREFDAVVLSCGATKPRDLAVPGRELSGVHFAMDFLPQQNKVNAGDTVRGQILATGKRVTILGGGDTGSDCLGTSNRQGAKLVHQFELLPEPRRGALGSVLHAGAQGMHSTLVTR